jgi:hypothetical protein
MELENAYCWVYQIWIKDPEIESYLEEQEDGESERRTRRKYPNGRILICTKDCILKDDASPFDHGLPPYVMFYDYRKTTDVWGIGEITMIKELHREYNRQLQSAACQGRINQRKNFLVDEDAGLDIELIKETFFEGGNVYSANFNKTDQPIRAVDTGGITKEVIQLMAMIPDMIEEVSAVGDLMKGRADKKERQSASEISVMIESSYTRVRQKVKNLEWSIRRIAYLTENLIQQFYQTPRYINHKVSDEDGTSLQYTQVANNAEMLKEANRPPRDVDPDTGDPETDRQYRERLSKDSIWQETQKFLEKMQDEIDPIYWPFEIEIQTNTTLPKDKQTLANLFLRLAGLSMTPESPIDAEALLDALDVPNRQTILSRKEKAKKAEQKQAMMAKAQKTRPMGGASGPPGAGPPLGPPPGTQPSQPEGGNAI